VVLHAGLFYDNYAAISEINPAGIKRQPDKSFSPSPFLINRLPGQNRGAAKSFSLIS
jgi:hypothetical protein